MYLQQKGTIVEKLTEETLTERSQLQQLLSICAGIGGLVSNYVLPVMFLIPSGAPFQAICAYVLQLKGQRKRQP